MGVIIMLGEKLIFCQRVKITCGMMGKKTTKKQEKSENIKA